MELTDFQSEYFWIILVGFILAFIIGVGLGANGIENSFGPAINSGAIGYVKAYILASIFTIIGATLVGHDVALTLRKHIVIEELYKNVPEQILLGQLSILCAMSFWLIFATLLNLQIASSHAMIGSSIGFSVVAQGISSLEWNRIAKIAIGWIVAPLVSGILSAIMYIIIDFAILRRRKPLKCGLKLQPILYFFTILFMVFAVLFHGPSIIGFDKTPFWLSLLISTIIGLLSTLIFIVFFKNKLVKISKTDQPRINICHIQISDFDKIENLSKRNKPASNEFQPDFKPTPKGIINWFFPAKGRKDDEEAESIFRGLQVLIACFASFAYGSNEVGNIISMPATILYLYKKMGAGLEDYTPWWIFLFGGVSISVGIWCLGHRMIKTIEKKMYKITQSGGFAIVIGMAITTIVASKLGMPVSTTQGIIGSMVGVGLVKSGDGIKMKIIFEAIGAWFITLPVTGLISSGTMFLLMKVFL